jgi:hypothetical protein
VNELNLYAPWLAVAISAATLAYTIFNGRSKKIDERFDAIEKKLEAKAEADKFGVLVGQVSHNEHRLTIVENDLTHLPDQKTVGKLESMIAALDRNVGMLSERVKPIAAMADRIQEAIVEKVMS